MDRLYLTGFAVRVIRRMARRGWGFCLEPSEVEAIDPFAHKWTRMRRLGLDGLCEALGYTDGRVLEVRVPSKPSRLRMRGINSRVCSQVMPSKSFELLCSVDGPSSVKLPEDLELVVDSPPLSFVDAACRLSALVSCQKMDPCEAELRLLKLGVEECSTYALNPWNPQGGACSYGLEPVMSSTELEEYLHKLRGMRGLGLSRRVAELVFDHAASEMESLVYAALVLPPRLGGLGLVAPELNVEMPLSELQQLKLNHVHHITPDLLWRELRIIIEYLGLDAHDGAQALGEDSGRIQDYQVLGYLVFPLTYQHVRTPAQFNRFALRLASAMDGRGMRGTVAWVQELVQDRAFLASQRKLFAILLPAVQGR